MRILSIGLVALLCVAAAESGSAPKSPTDVELASWVREALAADPRVDAANVEVEVDSGVVRLSGSVPTLAGRKYAVVVSRRLLGVSAIVDQLEVDAPAVEDARLARDVKRRLASSASVDVRDLGVSAVEGTITLDGRVDSFAQYWQAELLATQVRGVRDVTNQIEVEPESARSDDAIAEDVRSTFERDTYLTGIAVGVSVQDGVVTLSGSTGSAFEKARAVHLARWISNVAGVHDRLTVRWERGRSDRIAVPVGRSDASLEAMIATAFAQDGRLDATQVSVEVSRGIARLSGRVSHAYERRLLEEAARNVVGIAWVSNDVDVVPPIRRDQIIATDVEEILLVDYALDAHPIGVLVDDGVVTLTGQVPSGFHRTHAEDVTARVLGVKRIVNSIEITRKTTSSDEDLEEAIRERLARDAVTAAVNQRIDVSVEGGIATLTGDVDTLAERRAARRIASRTPGIVKVHNRLVVDPYPYPWEDPPPDEPAIPWEYYEPPFPPWVAQTGGLNADSDMGWASAGEARAMPHPRPTAS